VRTEVRNQVTVLGNPVVSDVSLDEDPHRTWLWLGPVERGVELRRVTQPRGVESEEWSRPEHDPQVIERQTFDSLDAALEELVEAGVDTTQFEAIWKSRNPF
jgi:hypothetical protein